MDTIISSKAEAKLIINKCFLVYHEKGLEAFVNEVYYKLLLAKVKFPVLEYCAEQIFKTIQSEEHISFCDKIESFKTEGGNVLLGILLQKRLPANYKESIQKATQYISDADAWYVCDIIGERVYGYALLHMSEKTIAEVKRLANHKVNWVIRSLGAGIHYAIKKGLVKESVEELFQLLLIQANVKDKEIKQGIGWAAKTTAKFYPEIIHKYQSQIQDTSKVANWFRTKVSIGLNRNNYAKGSRG